MEFGEMNYRSYKPVQQAPEPQAVSFYVTAPLCIKEILKGRSYLASRAAKELDGEMTVLDLVGQEPTPLRQHDCECTFYRRLRPDLRFALLVHLKVILLPPFVSLPQLEAYVLAKNLLRVEFSQDLVRGSWPCQQSVVYDNGQNSLRQFF